MKTIIRILITLFLSSLAYECMVLAFHLVNEPSDRSLYTGFAILALLALFLPFLLWRLWRKRNDNVW